MRLHSHLCHLSIFVVLHYKPHTLDDVILVAGDRCGDCEGVRINRECSRKLRDGRDLVRVATPLCRTQLWHLGLFGFVYQQVWLVHVYCLKKECQILMSERKGLFNFRKEVRLCAP